MQQTYAIFQHHIKETSHEGTLPEVFCAAQEFADLKYSTKDTVNPYLYCPLVAIPAQSHHPLFLTGAIRQVSETI